MAFCRLAVTITALMLVSGALTLSAPERQERPREMRPAFAVSEGPVLSGENVGVRIAGQVADGRNGDVTVPGELVVKIAGRWVRVVPSGRVTTTPLR